jgi:hypothetical protein
LFFILRRSNDSILNAAHCFGVELKRSGLQIICAALVWINSEILDTN